MARPDPALGTAAAASLALAATLLLLPDAPWRAPLALLAGVWAPGYALVALLYPRGRLTHLERHALACAAGLIALPLLGLLVSESVGFRPLALAVAQLALIVAVGGASLARPGATEPPMRSPLPSWRVVAAVGVGALVAAGAALAPTIVARDPTPHSLAFEPFDLTPPQGEDTTIVLVAQAGSAPIEGTLVVLWGNASILQRELSLAEGAGERFELVVSATGSAKALSATWAGREVHATLRAEGPR